MPPLRISPLGASVTWGTGSSDGNGYRGPLREQLTGAGHVVNLVGFNPNGSMKDHETEGYPGFTVREVADKLPRVLDELKPNLFLVNAGINDCIQGRGDNDIDADMGQLLDRIYGGTGADAVVVLSGLLVNRNEEVDACAQRATAKYRSRIEKDAAAGRKIVYADMGAIKSGDLGDDGTHPTDDGYKKMADAWFGAIETVAGKGWITKAEPVEGLPEDGNQ